MHSLAQLQSGQLAAVRHLTIAEGLREFPAEILDLAETLEILDLSGNRLNSLPDDFDRLTKLRILFLSQNEFTEFPPVLANCPALEIIGFKSNQIEHIGEHSLPPRTRWLILTNNRVASLPDSIGQLPRLEKLMLAGNRLSALPDSLQHCRQLALLRIAANRLTKLPEWLLQLPRLAWLAFSGNPFLSHTACDLEVLGRDDVHIHEQLGEGASGWIHRASLRAAADHPVALKLFKGSVTSDGNPLDEMHISARIGHHPNLIKVLARYEHGEQHGLVMELIEPHYRTLGLPPDFTSCSRDTFADSTTLSSAEAVSLACQAADTLQHLHDRYLSHGDLYCHNLLLDEQSHLLLTDFGAASEYHQLSDGQMALLEKVEVLAFGHLLDDLLQTVADKDRELSEALTVIRDRCYNQDVAQRPDFSELLQSLRPLSAAGAQQVHHSTERRDALQ